MFLLTAYEREKIKSEEPDCCQIVCLYTVNSAVRLGVNAGYAALGYVLLSATPIAATTLTINAMVESAVIGTAIMIPIDIACQPLIACMSKKPDDDSCDSRLYCGPCGEVVDSMIVSLLGAQVKGLFASNVTTPGFVAAAAATGNAAVFGGLLAATVVIGGIVYCCVEMQNHEVAFLPTNCLPNITCRDIVYPCEVGLSICNREQMSAFIKRCNECCPRPNFSAATTAGNPAPRPEDIMRDDVPPTQGEYVNSAVPMAQTVDPNAIFQIPDAVVVGGSNVSQPVPSAPPLEAITRKDSSSLKLGMV